MQNTAIVMPNWIGDFILALSVIERKYTAKDSVTLIVPEKLAQLSAVISPYRAIIYRRSNGRAFRSTVNAIRQARFSSIYLLPRSFSSAYLAFRSGIGRRRGLQSDFRTPLLTDRLPRTAENRSFHLTREYAQVLETPHVFPELHAGFTPPPVTADRPPRTTIVLCPGAAFGPAKQWNGFNELPAKLPYLHFTVLGDEKDAEMIRSRALFTCANVENRAGKTTLAQAAQIVASSLLVVGNDSGLLHLAGYFGIPAIGVYGSTSPRRTRPLGCTTTIISAGMPCSPCFKKTCPRRTAECLLSISSDRVAQILLETLAKFDTKRLRNACDAAESRGMLQNA